MDQPWNSAGGHVIFIVQLPRAAVRTNQDYRGAPSARALLAWRLLWCWAITKVDGNCHGFEVPEMNYLHPWRGDVAVAWASTARGRWSGTVLSVLPKHSSRTGNRMQCQDRSRVNETASNYLQRRSQGAGEPKSTPGVSGVVHWSVYHTMERQLLRRALGIAVSTPRGCPSRAFATGSHVLVEGHR